MKAEERHELKENDLQNWFQYGLPLWIKQNGSYVLLAAALVLLGYQLWRYYNQKQEVKAQEAWAELLATEQPGVENRAMKLQAIVDQYDIKPLRALALRDMGNAYLESVASGVSDEGSAAGPLDKTDVLARAQKAFEQVVAEFPNQLLAAGSAKIGLAVVAEDRGDWDAARKQYEALADKSSPFAGTVFAQEASAKLKDISKLKDAPALAALVPATMPVEPATSPKPEGTTPAAASSPAMTRPASTQPK